MSRGTKGDVGETAGQRKCTDARSSLGIRGLSEKKQGLGVGGSEIRGR